MADISILFSGAMVRAILCGSKNQTRRAMKTQPGDDVGLLECGAYHPTVIDRHGEAQPGPERFGAWTVDGEQAWPSPYGRPGEDRLVGRETFYAFGRWETRYNAKKGRDEWHFVDMTLETGRRYFYAATGAPDDFTKQKRAGAAPAWWKRPAIHMPHAASRLHLPVTAIRVERLHDISEADARAEGIVPFNDGHGWHTEDGRHYAGDPIESYLGLWADINGEASARANPWVWCINFKRVENSNA